jgi:Kef-type K+ transport system membrane component KefB
VHDVLGAVGLSIIAAAVFALLARRIGQPLILGYVLGGVLLGPHLGLGLVVDEASIELIAEIGLVLLLFIIGLELSVPRVLEAGRTIVVSGLLQVPICAALAWFLLAPLTPFSAPSLDRLYLAFTMSLSSTLIVVKLLFDKFEMGTFAGRVTLGILVFQDLWAIAFLALQPNLRTLAPGSLVRSLAAGAVLVVMAALLSRYVLPGLFRAIASSTELMLVCSLAWCFLVAGAAGQAGLSKEMGALVAGMVIAAFPYGTEVTSRLSGVRDFFITLFFVALGLRVPRPSAGLLAMALAATVFVVLSRMVTVYPLFALLRLDMRTAGVVSLNLGQVSEFSLVIFTLGAGYGHVGPALGALVLYTLLLTAVVSTYMILFNHPIAVALSRALARTGLPHWLGAHPRQSDRGAGPADTRDLFLLGVSREGLAFLRQLERQSPAMKKRIVAIDFNPETLERLQADGVDCHYGDISNIETLRHAGIEKAAVVVSSISDWFLKGTDNLRLVRLTRVLAPNAQVVVTADTLEGARRLYAEGAAYVLVPPAFAAQHLHELLRDTSPTAFGAGRKRQAAELFGEAGTADGQHG